MAPGTRHHVAETESAPEIGERSSAFQPGALHGMTLLVTGGTKRIGREIALSLAQEGVNVVVHYRSSLDEAKAVCGDLKSSGVDAWPLHGDFTDLKSAEQLISHAKQAAGKLDGLINSAASFTARTIQDLDFCDISESMRVNTWAPFILSREFFRVERKGNIINILDGRISGYDWSHVGYILSKNALALLTRMMALAFAPETRVNAVAPGLILPPAGEGLSFLEHEADAIPLKRHGDPRDIASAVLFLLKSKFITGQILYIDGGRHLERGSQWIAC